MEKTHKFIRLQTIFLLLLMLCSLFASTAYAQEVSVSTTPCPSYFEYYTSSGQWRGIGTPLHVIDSTGQVAYCLQTNYKSPCGSGYSSIDATNYYDQTTLNGLQAILENGYPSSDGGFGSEQARYATANAIRFWLAERNCEGVPSWFNQTWNSGSIRAVSGYESLYDWALYLLDLARNQSVSGASIVLDPADLELRKEGNYYVGTTTVTLHNCSSYTIDTYTLPFGTDVEGMTGSSGDVLTIKIRPDFYSEDTLEIWMDGDGTGGSASLLFFGPYNSSEQRMLAYDVDAYGTNTSAKLTAHIAPEIPTGRLEIHKVDAETDDPISGVTFALGNSDGNQIRSATTDSNGNAIFDNLELGDYFYIEETAPDGYIIDKEKHQISIRFNGEVVSQTQINHKGSPTGSLRIHKLDSSTQKAIEGVTYELIDSSNNIVATRTTNADGYVEFPDLKLGTYKYREKSAPEGYIIDGNSYTVEITEGGKIISETRYNTYEEPVGSLKLLKIDNDTRKPLQGVKYEIRSADNSYKVERATNKDGYIYLSDLPLGTYFYKEVKALPDYEIDTVSHQININERGQTISEVRTNKYHPPTGLIEVGKKDYDTGKHLAGAVFEIKNSKGKVLDRQTTDSNGIACFRKLPLDTYTIYETKAPEGYQLSNSVKTVTLDKSGEVIIFWVTNKIKPVYCSFTVHKVDPSGKNLEGAVFSLYTSKDGGKNYDISQSVTTGRNGIASFEKLNPDYMYKLIEVKSPDGMELYPNPIFEGKIDKANLDMSFTVSNHPMVALPFTGGSSFNYIPVLMLVLSTGFYFIKKHTKENTI